MLHSWRMHVQSALLFESPSDIYARVFRDLKPRTTVPEISIRFCKFANANSFIKMADGRLELRITDILEGAPAAIHESLAVILLSKLFRKPVPRMYSHRYRLYFNRVEMRRTLHLVRQQRGHKNSAGPEGHCYDLSEVFETINQRFFNGLMARPDLGWSRRKSRTILGHFDPAHNAIVLSKLLDGEHVPRLVVEYVMYHEMLHLRHPVESDGVRRSIHTRDFKAAEKLFPDIKLAKELLKKL